VYNRISHYAKLIQHLLMHIINHAKLATPTSTIQSIIC